MRTNRPGQPRSGTPFKPRRLRDPAKPTAGTLRPGLALVGSKSDGRTGFVPNGSLEMGEAPHRPGRQWGLPLIQSVPNIETRSATTPIEPLEPTSTLHVEKARARHFII